MTAPPPLCHSNACALSLLQMLLGGPDMELSSDPRENAEELPVRSSHESEDTAIPPRASTQIRQLG